MGPVRILFVTSSYPSATEDPRGIFIHRLAREVVRQGSQVTVLAPGAPGAPGREERDGVSVIRQTYWVPRYQTLTRGLQGIVPNLRDHPGLTFQVPFLIAALMWRATVEAHRHDVTHAHWIYPAGLAAVLGTRLARKPLVVTSHGGDVNLAATIRPLRVLSRVVCRNAAACVGVSEAVTEALGKLGVAQERIAFIPLGVDPVVPSICDSDLPETLRHFQEADAFRILYLGSLTVRKSVHTLVSAHRCLELAGHRVMTAIVGDGPSAGALAAAIRDARTQQIILAGSQAPHLVPRWLASSDVLVLPSLSEGRPTVIIEAMAAGKPVVATDIAGTRELVSAGRTGFLVPPGDDRALADRLSELLANPSLRQSMGDEARMKVEVEGLTTEAAARRYRDLYERVSSTLRRP